MSIRTFTFLSRSEQRLSQCIRNLDIPSSSTTLFALRTPTSNLQAIFKQVNKLSSATVGCISGQLNPIFPFCAAFITIPNSVDHRVWRSTIPGKEKAQVGRWYSREQMSREPQEIDVDSILSWKEGRSAKVPTLPSPLQELADTQRSTSSILYFTDDASEGLAHALIHHFPQAPKLGLTASSTPFVTGRPFTLYESGSFHSSGAVGVAIARKSRAQCTVNFNDLQGISPQMSVTSSGSNMIYTLDGVPAVDLLAKSMVGQGRDSRDAIRTIFLGMVDAQGKLSRTFGISAGTPSRGAILLEGEQAPTEGTIVQFMVLQEKDSSYSGILIPKPTIPEARFVCLAPDESTLPQSVVPKFGLEECIEIEDRFVAASEGGFFVHKGGLHDEPRSIWHCTTPHTTASLSLRN